MNSTLGNTLILAALGFAVVGAIVGIGTGLMREGAGVSWARRAVVGFFVAMLGANLTMIHALVTHDFSVKYVAQVGSRSTPLVYTIVSLWSALEGSILFWGLILGTYLLAFMLSTRNQHQRYMSLALGVMLAVGTFFAFLIAGPANPFGVVSPVPPDGPGPNALLQNHVLMVIHPPMLYLGYVGMVVPFGISVASLLRGEMGQSLMAPLRRWTIIPWTFLSVGIILGAWWAYAVLGWGGYWAWDPVENASFLPWLTATAFLHSIMVMERKRLLTLWTMCLGLASFVLTILGTFMTRSGIFNSVHSFTQSEIGPTFLVFLAIILFASIALIATRGHLLLHEPGEFRSAASREVSMLVNNLLFAGLTFVVLIGTTWPLIAEAVFNKRMSVGEPYFNRMFVPGATAVVFLMGIGPVLPWSRGDSNTIVRQFIVPLVAAFLTTVVCLAMGLRGFWALTTYGAAAFAVVVTLREMFLPGFIRMKEKQEPLHTALFHSIARARRRFGGYVVHLAILMIAVAVASSRSYVEHKSATLKNGNSMELGGYTLTFQGMTSGKEPRREYVAAKLLVRDSSGEEMYLAPRMNYYEGRTDPVQTPSVLTRAKHDLYISLMAYQMEQQSATFNVWVFPLVGWIWWSIPLLVIGALIAAWPQRKPSLSVSPAAMPAPAVATVPPPQGIA
ncbi:MAG: heme lyase CcmF/NrfE family subunit [Myxococcaceae bacterium]